MDRKIEPKMQKPNKLENQTDQKIEKLKDFYWMGFDFRNQFKLNLYICIYFYL